MESNFNELDVRLQTLCGNKSIGDVILCRSGSSAPTSGS